MRRLLYPLDWILSLAASLLRLGAGGRGQPVADQREPLVLYEFENCPFCRIAREAISETGALVDVRPSPKGGTRFRPEAVRLGGKAMFPFLIDPNTGTSIHESADIARYVRETYAPGRKPFTHRLGPLSLLLSIAVFWIRPMRGIMVRASKAPLRPLEFHGPENSPGARIIREMLSTHELRYFWTSAGASFGLRLADPNTGATRHGALAILTHLDRTYSA